MALTNIEWTWYRNAQGLLVRGYTFNAWLGCDKVSPACVRCYIVRTPTFRFRKLKHGDPRVRTAVSTWEQPLAWDRKAAREGVRPRVFTNSLADWLDDRVPIEWFVDLLWLVYRTPNLDWLMLTKRPQNWAARLEMAIGCQYQMTQGIPRAAQQLAWFRQWMIDWSNVNKGQAHPLVQPPPNVWVGTTVEDQTRADERIPLLLSIPATVRFLSCEPLLGPLNLVAHVERRGEHYKTLTGTGWLGPEEPRIHWVIAGGESGDKKDPGVRPSHPSWFRDLRDQCTLTDVPFFFKQWGDWKGADEIKGGIITLRFSKDTPSGPKHPEWHDWEDGWKSARLGKKAAGRLLDGREWNEIPVPRQERLA